MSLFNCVGVPARFVDAPASSLFQRVTLSMIQCCTGVVAVPVCNIVDDPEQMSMLHMDHCSSVVIVDDPELMLMLQCCNCYRVVVLNDLASVSTNSLREVIVNKYVIHSQQ